MMKNILERLKICWYTLTKKEYAFWAYDKLEIGKTGCIAYISNANDRIFFESIQEHITNLIKEE